MTYGKTIIMGRITFESLPYVLPVRHHVVVTRDTNFIIQHPDVEIVNSLDDLSLYVNSPVESFVIGGGQIYAALLPLCRRLYLTRVHKNFNADVYFPAVSESSFKLIHSSELSFDHSENVSFTFETYERL